MLNVDLELIVQNGCILDIYKKAPVFTLECDIAVDQRLSLDVPTTGNYFDFFLCSPSNCLSIAYKTMLDHTIYHVSQPLDISEPGNYYIGVKREGPASYYPSLDNFDVKRNGVSLLTNTGFEEGVSPWMGYKLIPVNGQEVNSNWNTNTVMVVPSTCTQGFLITP